MERELAKVNDMGIEVSDMMLVFMMVIVASLMGSVVTPLTQQMQAQTYRGQTDVKTINADGTLRWLDVRHNFPYTPWVSAFFINDGPDPVQIAINYPDDRFTIYPDETRTVDRSGAQERISIIFYVCQKGKTASVRIEGEY
jgi:hypothetical protein